MKKIYCIPSMQALQIQGEQVLAASGVTSNNGINWGGVDTDGELDPSVKANIFEENPFE